MSPASLKDRLGNEEYENARLLYREGSVRELKRQNDRLLYSVAGPGCTVTLFSDGSVSCACGAQIPCRHIGAAMMDAAASGALRAMYDTRSADRGKALISVMESALPQAAAVRMEPDVYIDGSDMRLGLRIGTDRLYVVRSLPAFLESVTAGMPIPFGKGFTYYPDWMCPEKEAQGLVSLLTQHCESLKMSGAHLAPRDARYLPLPASVSMRVWEQLENMPFRLFVRNRETAQKGISGDAVPLTFTLSDRTHSSTRFHRLCITAESGADMIPLTEDWSYVLSDQAVIRIGDAQKKFLRLCGNEWENGRTVFLFDSGQTDKVLGEMLLWLTRIGNVHIAPELESKLVRAPFSARIYLDRDGSDITIRTQFVYGRQIIDPFVSDSQSGVLLLRDAQKEQQITDLLASFGFRIRPGSVYLHRPDDIYRFMTEGIALLSEHAEVFLSREFSAMQPRRPVLRGALRTAGGHLSLEMTENEAEIEELLPLMQALRDRASYFRFRDGSFITLDGLEDWQPLAQTLCESLEQDDPGNMAVWRAAYLKSLISSCGLPVSLDSETDHAAQMKAGPFASPINCLRPYQKQGFEWLCTLRSLRMGGILADDMGLGKTVQAIAALLYSVRTETPRIPSLIVAPTSLTYNWLSEIKRFAPELTADILSGSQADRNRLLQSILSGDAPDILITSYPLIRRDADLISGISFRFAVLDEAQQIKNAASAGAHAVKRIQAETRIALTGTPMENHAGELWSIFDFILPGYLPRPRVFMQRYGNGENSEDLLRRIRPFLLRRLKRDVLSELPDKMERTVVAEMVPEQSRVYRAALLRYREKVKWLLADRGFDKSSAEVLSAITEMRQICCHPGLCLPDYAGTSGKMEALIDLLIPALQSGHRALVFSQFTRMLRIIQSRLSMEGIDCLYLDGSTPASERLSLCADFNEGKGSVFLLSLKAGGTGLNLVGADMVIHYDPWWNPATEEQAVDRAHRIGQARKLEVIRLITHDSIEEKVVEMSAAKRKLFDQLITAGIVMPNRMTPEEIMLLFE